MVHCTCGHLLRKNESSRDLHQWQLDARHGKTEAQNEHFITHNARKRCVKKNFGGIHDRFQKDLRCRDAQLKADRTEEKCIEMDELAQKDFTYRPSTEEFEMQEKLVHLSQHIWTKCTDETPIRFQRSINKDAPASPLVWRRAICTDSFLPVSEMAFVVFFIQYIMVAVE